MNTPLLVDDQHPDQLTATRPAADPGRPTRTRYQPTHRRLETPAEAVDALTARPPDQALAWFTGYLHRRDQALAELAAEEYASVLETLATDFRGEAAAAPTGPHAIGLSVAALVISDTAAAIRSDQPRDSV